MRLSRCGIGIEAHISFLAYAKHFHLSDLRCRERGDTAVSRFLQVHLDLREAVAENEIYAVSLLGGSGREHDGVGNSGVGLGVVFRVAGLLLLIIERFSRRCGEEEFLAGVCVFSLSERGIVDHIQAVIAAVVVFETAVQVGIGDERVIQAVLPIEDGGSFLEVELVEKVAVRLISFKERIAIDRVAVGIVHAKPRLELTGVVGASLCGLVVHAADEAAIFAEIGNGSREALVARGEHHGGAHHRIVARRSVGGFAGAGCECSERE